MSQNEDVTEYHVIMVPHDETCR